MTRNIRWTLALGGMALGALAGCGPEEEDEPAMGLTVQQAADIQRGQAQQPMQCTDCEPCYECGTDDPPPPPPPSDTVTLYHRQVVRRTLTGEIFVYMYGKLVYIPTWDSLTALGIGTSSIRELSETQIAPYMATRRYPVSQSGTPGSFLFPPDMSKWLPITGLDPSIQYLVEAYRPGYAQEPSGFKQIAVTELHGWFTGHTDSGCHADEEWGADRDGTFILDPQWALSKGINLHKLITAGTIMGHNMTTTSFAAMSDLAIKVELNAVNPGPAHDPKWWRPQDWLFELQEQLPDGSINYTCTKIDPTRNQRYSMVWPFNPRFGENIYVALHGSLVLDHAHSGDYSGNFFDAARVWDGTNHFDNNERDPNNPARWTEMHPPDAIVPLPGNPDGDGYMGRAIALVASNGLFYGDASLFDQTFDAPPPPTNRPYTHLEVQEMVGPESNLSTIIPGTGNSTNTGARIDVLPSASGTQVRLRIAVQGQGGYGIPGKFKAIYIIKWV